MSDVSLGYDDLLDDGAHHLRNRIIVLCVGAAIVAGAAYGIWATVFSSGGTTKAQAQTATVDRGSVTKSVSTSGVVSAQQTSSLSFQQSGKVTKVNVGLGQPVKQGDVLAEVDPTDLQAALQTANTNVASAQVKLSQLLQGSTASQLAAADQALTQAQASYDKAARALYDLQKPPAATDLAAAQQAVGSAQAQVAQGQQSRAKLDTANQDAVTAAQTVLDKAQRALNQATTTASTTGVTVSSAQSTLFNAETAYCPDAAVSFCSSHTAPLGSSDTNALVTASDTGAPDRAGLASKVLSANTAYTKALGDDQTAANAVTSAQSDVQTAQAALNKAQQGPTIADIAAADAAINAAQAALNSAQAKFAILQAGPTQEQLDAAQSDIDTAAASVRSAQAKRDETYQGSLPTDIQLQRQAVSQQQLAADKAQRDLDKTRIIAPFDGTVAVLNVQVGDNSGASGGSGTSSSSSAAILLNTPNVVRLDLTVSETDLPNVKVGQSGVAQFDAIPGRNFPMVIDSIGTNPTTTQGVVTYAARARLIFGPPAGAAPAGAPPAGSPAATGSGTPAAAGPPTPAATTAGATPAAPTAGEGTPGSGQQRGNGGTLGAGGRGSGAGSFGGATGAAANARPVPGMNARITIVTDDRQNVLRVPVSAVQRSGRDSVVQVKLADGSTQTVTVVTGLIDGQRIEVTSGVDEGATVVLPGVAAAVTSPSAATRVGGAGLGGGGFDGGGGGGGGGGNHAGGGGG